MSKRTIAITGMLTMILVAASGVVAGEDVGNGDAEKAENLNEIALFTGITDERSEDPVFSTGLEYTRKIAPSWAIGGIAEFAFGGSRDFVLAVPVCFWPVEHLKLLAAPGVEYSSGSEEEDESDDDSESEDSEHTANFLFRIGVGYGFDINEHFGIEPSIDLDFVDNSRTLVYGINFTYGW